MFQLIRDMGILRNLLHGTALLFAILMPFASGPEYSDSWDLFFGGVLPATAPIIIIVIGLDVMMSSIWKSDADVQRVRQLNNIITAHLIVGALLLGAWLLAFLPVLT